MGGGVKALRWTGIAIRASARHCDAIASRTNAQRAVIRGAQHSVPRVGQPFNDLLEQFWLDSEKTTQTTEKR